ncbi:MAG: redoxin domain-containing protein [Ardenticatenaceae bacterium]|nr:redoxin domain-containing protein [Ardenticatenaceae bacterium]
MGRFEELNAQVLGISVDSVFSHRAYAEQLGVTFPLLADFHPKGKVVREYGLWNEQWGVSKRAVVVVDGAGVVQHFEVIVKGPPDVEVILQAVQRLVG